jgi:hypothetical protein
MTMRDATIAPSGEGGPATGRPLRGGRFAIRVRLSVACLLAAACSSEPPRQIAVGEDIEVGPYVFKVVRGRPAPNPPPPISTFRSQPGKKGIVVFVDWKTLDGNMDVMRRLAFVESFLENQLSIADAEGKRTKVFGAMQARLMYMEDPGPNWRDWVVVFHVPDDSRDLTLMVENPEPRDGQARVTAVPLGL